MAAARPPPPMAPPPPPGGHEGGAADMQGRIVQNIQKEVAAKLGAACADTEVKVKAELGQLRDQLGMMDSCLDQLILQLDGSDPEGQDQLGVETAAVALSTVEQHWGEEVRVLKQELHQTILAHNHNADLIKHHKDTIDSLRERCLAINSVNVRTVEISHRLATLDSSLTSQSRHQKLEPLLERVAALERRIQWAATSAQVQGIAWQQHSLNALMARAGGKGADMHSAVAAAGAAQAAQAAQAARAHMAVAAQMAAAAAGKGASKGVPPMARGPAPGFSPAALAAAAAAMQAQGAAHGSDLL